MKIDKFLEHYEDGRSRVDVTVFVTDRSKYVGGSEIGQCIRKIWYAKHQPVPDKTNGFAARGKWMEGYVVRTLLAAGLPLRSAQGEQMELTEGPLMATPDGYLEFNDGCQVVEIKSVDPRTNFDNLPKSNHISQLKQSMTLMARSGKADCKKHGGILLYVDASDYSRVVASPVPYEDVFDAHSKRANRILRARTPARLDRGGRVGGEGRVCSYRSPCGVLDAQTSQSDQKRANRGSVLDRYVHEYAKIQTAEKAQKERKAELKNSIQMEMQSRNSTSLVVNGVPVTLQQRNGSKTIDRKAAAAAGVDLSPFEKVGAPSTVLKVG